MAFSLHDAYEAFPRVEEEFGAALDESLHPRGPGMLYELVAGFGLPPGAVALDVGCGEGRHTVALAERFGFAVIGIDPVPSRVALAGGAGPVFAAGVAERLPVADASVDLVWCRDVLVHVADQRPVYAEFRRVLRPGGRALVYQMFGTDRLEPREAAGLRDTMGLVCADPAATEAAIDAAGLRVDERIELGTEWGEWAQERDGKPGRKLLHAARLLRDRDRFVERFGAAAYDMMLGDCLWHVYAMIGKLTRRVYVLTNTRR